ncbi:MAG: hypothetical protein LW710_09850 [Burkholderiales bacterium]|jgi:hypothetical protein|uniref:hypothetical protein n=1 Tax=Limnobacter sp. TaxID=2003368 RepID=UPI0039504D0B|nr:hypothetical protein [Burkholderiales bacterium]
MNSSTSWILASILCALPLLTSAQETTSNTNGSSQMAGTTDAETGLSTRTWLKEQAEGINRGEVEAYSAESAGKAYRAYTESIGAKDQKAPVSQVSTIKTN